METGPSDQKGPARRPRGGPGPVARWRLSGMLRLALLVVLVAAGVSLAVLTIAGKPEDAGFFAGAWGLLAVGAMSMAGEFLDSSIGMGHGIVLAPLLLVLGFEPVEIVPALLLAEAVSGLLAGALHHRFANFDVGAGSRDRSVLTTTTALGCLGGLAGVLMAADLGERAGEVAIGVIVAAVGLFVLFARGRLGPFSLAKVGVLGVAASGTKAISGAGFGPVLVCGQIGFGVPARNAVGVTTLAEGVVSSVAFLAIVLVNGAPQWRLAAALAVGAALATPASAWTVRLVPDRTLIAAVGWAACALGGLTLLGALVG